MGRPVIVDAGDLRRVLDGLGASRPLRGGPGPERRKQYQRARGRVRAALNVAQADPRDLLAEALSPWTDDPRAVDAVLAVLYEDPSR
jgi:hypothetical protein